MTAFVQFSLVWCAGCIFFFFSPGERERREASRTREAGSLRAERVRQTDLTVSLQTEY